MGDELDERVRFLVRKTTKSEQFFAKMTATEVEKANNNSSTVRRNRPGTKSSAFSRWPDETFEEMDSTLAVQQFIQQTIRKDVMDVEAILSAPETQDEGVWKYEHLRQFCMELNGLAVALQGECQPENCSQMTATEQWIFLCAAHKTPKECPAIDYTRHTLDGAACLLPPSSNFRNFRSRNSSLSAFHSFCYKIQINDAGQLDCANFRRGRGK